MSPTQTIPAAPVPLSEDLSEVLYQAQHQLGLAYEGRPCECHLLLVTDDSVRAANPLQWCEACQLRWARLQTLHYTIRHHVDRIRNLTTAVSAAAELCRYFDDRQRRLADGLPSAVVG